MKLKKKERCPFCWCKITKADRDTFHRCNERDKNIVSGIIIKEVDSWNG